MITANVICNQCMSPKTTLDGARTERGIAPSGNPYIQIVYYCENCKVASFLILVHTPEGIQIA